MTDAPDADRTDPADAATPQPGGPQPARAADDAAHAPAAAPEAEAAPQASPEQVMDLLADHVPLALLMDLVTPEGPPSDEILRAEGMPDDAWWQPEGDAEPEPADGPAAPLGTDPASDDPDATA